MQWGISVSDRWERWFQELKEFKEEHNDITVPENHPGGLKDWVKRQRSKKKSGRLDADQTQKLEELGLRWESGRDYG